MTYRLPEDIKHIIYAMNDPYPYLKPDPGRGSYKYHRKKFRKHGFWSSVCWDLDWAVILYITAAVSIDNPKAVDEDGDSILATLKSIIARENAWFDFDNDVPVKAEKTKYTYDDGFIVALNNTTTLKTYNDIENDCISQTICDIRVMTDFSQLHPLIEDVIRNIDSYQSETID